MYLFYFIRVFILTGRSKNFFFLHFINFLRYSLIADGYLYRMFFDAYSRKNA